MIQKLLVCPLLGTTEFKKCYFSPFALLPSHLIGLQLSLASLSRVHSRKSSLRAHSIRQGFSGADSLRTVLPQEPEWTREPTVIKPPGHPKVKNIVHTLYTLVGPVLEALWDTKALDIHLTGGEFASLLITHNSTGSVLSNLLKHH